jgi:ketohexokinase/beta-glucosidase
MSKLGFTDSDIVKEFEEKKWTIRQVQHARNLAVFSPPSRRNRQGPLLRTAHRKKIIDWIKESPSHRLIKWEHIPRIVDVGIPYGIKALKAAMRTEGYARRVSRIRPPIINSIRYKRVEFALAHINWTWIDWFRYLWSDETWVTGGSHGIVWITRLVRDGEEWNEDTITKRHRKRPR